MHVAGLNIAGNRPQSLIGVMGMAMLYLEGFWGLERGGGGGGGGFKAFPQMLQFPPQRLLAVLGMIYLSDWIKTNLEGLEIPTFSWGHAPRLH